MSLDIATLGLRVDARQVREGDRALQDLGNTGQRVEQQVDRTNDAMKRLAAVARTVAAALATNELIKQADAWANLQGRLSLVADTQDKLAKTTDALFNLAQRTRSGLIETASLYSKITTSTEALNKTDEQRLRVTESINKAMVISGASSQAAAAALMQLGQAFAANRLGGEELNSVLEQSPRLAQAIAAGIGKNVGDLKSLAEAGKLTAETVFRALESQSATLDAEFQKMPKTVGQALVQIENAFLRTVGVFDQQNKLSSGLAEAIGYVAENMDRLAKAAAGVAVVGLVAWLQKGTDALFVKLGATMAVINAEREAAATALASAEADLVAARAAAAAASANVAAALGSTERTAAMARQIATAEGVVIAENAVAAAQTRAAGTAGLASLAVGALGGPMGLLLTALSIGAVAWGMWGNAAKDANDKAKGATEKSTNDIIDDLNKQTNTLLKRVELAKQAGMKDVAKGGGPGADRLAEQLADIQALQAKVKAGMATDSERGQLDMLTRDYGRLKDAIKGVADAQGKVDAQSNAEKFQNWMQKHTEYMDKAGKFKAAVAEAKKEMGDAAYEANKAQVDKMIKASLDKGDIEKATTAYKDAIKAGKEYIQTLILEREEIGATESQIRMLKAAREASKVKGNTKEAAALRLSIMEESVALDAAAVAWKKKTEAEEAAAKLQKDSFDTPTEKAWEQVRALQEEIKTYGMAASAVTRLAIAKAQASLSTPELSPEETSALESQLAALKEIEKLQSQKDQLDSLFEPSKAQSFGDALRDAFGNAGSALGRLTDLMGAYADKTVEAEKARAAAKRKYGEKDAQAIREVGKINAQQEKDRIDAYADMAGAAKGFFKENTAGYKVLQAAETGLRVYQLAMNAQVIAARLMGDSTVAASSVASSAVVVGANTAIGTSAAAAGVATQAIGDPYTAWARMAAMAAAMATLGFAVFGGRSGPNVSEERQKTQGTGTVLGDSSAKSNSIARAIELTSANSSTQIDYLGAMLGALRGIQSNIERFAARVAQNSDIGSPNVGSLNSNNGLATTATTAAIVSTVLVTLGPLAAATTYLATKIPVIGNLVGKLATSIFGGKQTLEDSGFTMGRNSLSSIVANGANAQTYADIKTSGGWFSSDKRSTQSTNLDAATNQQFTAILKSMADSITEAGKLIGVAGSDFDSRLSSFVVDIGKVSLKGLTGEEQQKALQAVFSKLGDQMAQWAIGGLQSFAKEGEGYLETLTRVANNYGRIDQSLNSIGRTFGAIGVQSIAARESLVELMGGIDSLQTTASSFAQNFLSEGERLAPVAKYVSDELGKMGLSWVDTRDEFKRVVLALDLTTQAGREQYASLMKLSDAFAATHEAVKDLTKSAQEIADERADLQSQLDDLTMSAAQKLAKQRAALDASNRSLFDQVQAAIAAKEANDALRESMTKQVETFGNASKSLRDYGSSLMTGNLSTLTPAQQLAEAKRQYETVAQQALAGDETALGKIQSVADKFLQLSQQVNGGDSVYSADYSNVLAMIEKIASYSDSRVDSAKAQIEALDRATAATQALADAITNAPQQANNDALASEFAAWRAEQKARDEAAAKLQIDAANMNRDVTMVAADTIVKGLSAGVRRVYNPKVADAELDR